MSQDVDLAMCLLLLCGRRGLRAALRLNVALTLPVPACHYSGITQKCHYSGTFFVATVKSALRGEKSFLNSCKCRAKNLE
jgi:hypothetical protein